MLLDMERAVFIGDTHHPYHDQRALDVTLSFIEWFNPHIIHFIGDMADCAQISKFNHNPETMLKLQDDLDILDDFFARVREIAPNATINFYEGNHEQRILSYLWQHPEIAGLHVLQPAQLFNLEKHNINWVTAKARTKYHGFLISHGTIVRKFSGYSARGQLEKWGCSGITGHTHRTAVHRNRKESGEGIWIENGCLCQLEADYIRDFADWHHGFSVSIYDPVTDLFQADLINMIDYKFSYGGKVFA